MSPLLRLLSLSLSIASSTAFLSCSASGPPCAFLELDGETLGGGAVILEDPLHFEGRANRVIAVSVSGVPEIPGEDYRATYAIDCDDADCPVDVECSPDIIDAGQAMFCDVFDRTEEGAEACDWSCRIAFEVGHGDTSVCTAGRVVYELIGRHEPE